MDKFFHKRDLKNTKLINQSSFYIKIFLCIYLCIFKIWGLFPWNISLFSIFHKTKLKDHVISPLYQSHFGSLYNVILIFLITILHANDIALVYESSDNTRTTKAVRSNIIIFGYITSIIILIIFTVRQKAALQIVNHLVKVDKVLNKCRGYILKENFWFYIFLLINFLMAMTVPYVQLTYKPPIVFIVWTTPATLSNWLLLQYSLIIHSMTKRFESINNYILKLCETSTDLRFLSIFVVKLPLPKSITPEITNIKYAYMELYSICHNIAAFYTFPTLVAIIYISSLNLYYSYFLLVVFFQQWSILTKEVVVDILWIVLTCYDLVILATQVNIFTHEFKKTADNIHWILNMCSIAEDTEEKLIEFSGNLLNKNIPFKVYEMMSLDGSLLYIIISTAVSYLIIIIQFRFNNDKLK